MAESQWFIRNLIFKFSPFVPVTIHASLSSILQLPYLIDGDLKITETMAIYTYLARKFDLSKYSGTLDCAFSQIRG